VTAEEVGERAAELLGGARRGDKLTKAQRVERGRRDILWFCRYYLAEKFPIEPPEFHREAVELAAVEPRCAFAAPREHAKSTLMSFGFVLHRICYGFKRHIGLLWDTDSNAKIAVDDIRQELEENEKLRADFGDLIGDRKWTEAEFVTATGAKVFGRGRGSKLRGLKHRGLRPDLLVCDDLEDEDSVDSRDQRDKTKRWFARTVINSIDKDDGQIVVVGTILHHDALLPWLLKKLGWTARLWRAIEASGKALWPAKWSLDDLEKRKAEIGTRAFAQEFLNETADQDDLLFSLNWWKTFQDADLNGVRLAIAAAVDPAIGQKAKNDETAVAVVGESDGRYYVLSIRMARLRFTRQIERVLDTAMEWPTLVKFGVESQAYQEALRESVVDASDKRNLQIPFTEITHHSDKIRRIARLAPLAENGKILWPGAGSKCWSKDVPRAQEQFEQLGQSSSQHDDGADAIEMAIGLLRGVGHRRGRVRLLRRAA